MCFPAEARQATTGIDSTDIWPDGLEGRERTALCLNLANDVLADTGTQIRGRAGEPAAFLMQKIASNALRLLEQVLLVALRLVESGDGLVDLLAAYAGRGFKAVGGAELTAGDLLGLDKLAEQDVAVGESFFDDEGVVGMVG